MFPSWSIPLNERTWRCGRVPTRSPWRAAFAIKWWRSIATSRLRPQHDGGCDRRIYRAATLDHAFGGHVCEFGALVGHCRDIWPRSLFRLETNTGSGYPTVIGGAAG